MFKGREIDYEYGKINLLYDSRKKGEKQAQIVEGDEETLSALIGALIHNLLESGFDREMLEYAIEEGLGKNKKKKIQVKEIHITNENAKDFEKLLKKLAGED